MVHTKCRADVVVVPEANPPDAGSRDVSRENPEGGIEVRDLFHVRHNKFLRSGLSGSRVGCGWTIWSSLEFSSFDISYIIDSPFYHLRYWVQKEE
jgi:hypothetical protein